MPSCVCIVYMALATATQSFALITGQGTSAMSTETFEKLVRRENKEEVTLGRHADNLATKDHAFRMVDPESKGDSNLSRSVVENDATSISGLVKWTWLPHGDTIIFGFEILIATLAFGFFVSSWAEDLQNGFAAGGTYPSQKCMALAAYLALVVCTDLATKREADRYFAHTHNLKPLVIVLCVESGKLIVSFCMQRCLPEQSCQSSWSEIWKVATLLAPVSLMYAANNTLTFLLLATNFLDTYVTWRNMSVVLSGLMWMTTFRKLLPGNRLVAIFVVFVGCMCNSMPVQGRLPWGILASSLLSVGASVLNERVIKAPETREVSINTLNMVMYAQTSLAMSCTFVVAANFYVALNYASLSELCRSITSATLVVVSCQVALGLVISRVLKHADSVSKTMVGAVKEIMVVGIGFVAVQKIHRDKVALGGSVVASVACLIYFAKDSKGMRA